MNLKNSLCFFATLLVFSFCGCDKVGVFCTEEFRTVGVDVNGKPLTDYYTIRIANGDTIRPIDQGFSDNYYTILDDNFQSEIENDQETFNFIGEINDTVVINELYVIKADHCHIEKVSGLNEITL